MPVPGRRNSWAPQESPFISKASLSLLPLATHLHAAPPNTHASGLIGVFLHRLSGAVIKGYEQDVGTRTSFYGFTAFSLTQSLYILGRRGFQHVPLGKVSKEE